MINKIETDRLVLRKAKISDLDNIYNNVWSDSSIADNMLWEVTKSREDAIDRLNITIKYQKDHYAYFICLKDTDEAIGFIGVFEKEKDIYEDSGLCISEKYQGLGFAKEAVKALIDIIFNELNGKMFLYSCFNTNEKSRIVCTKLGFKYRNSKTIIRDYDKKEFIVDYYYLDRDMYLNGGY